VAVEVLMLMSVFTESLLSQQLYRQKNKIIDRTGRKIVVCPQSGEIFTKIIEDIATLKEFYGLQPPERFISAVCKKLRKSKTFIRETIAYIKNQFQIIGITDFESIKIANDEISYCFILSWILKKLRFDSAQNCLEYLIKYLEKNKMILNDLLQDEFSIIPNLWIFFEFFNIYGINPPNYLLNHEITCLKLKLIEN
jgi:hypothetical protein